MSRLFEFLQAAQARGTQRSNSYSSVPFGLDSRTWTSATATNFTFLPEVIGARLYQFSAANILKHWRKGSLTTYLVQILPWKALDEGFHFCDPKDEEEKPVDSWEVCETLWKKLKMPQLFQKTVHSERAFGLGLLYYDPPSQRFQVITGDRVAEVEANAFDDLTKVTVQLGSGRQSLDMERVRWHRRDFPGDIRGFSYLEPIWDRLIYIEWVTFSMVEAAAAEGSKLITLGIKNPQKGDTARVLNSLPGLSSRKAYVYPEDLIPGGPKVLDTKLSALFVDYLDACNRQVALYTCIPESHLSGLRQGAYLGAKEDTGSESEALHMIQRDCEEFLRDLLAKEPFNFENDDLKMVWHKQSRMSELDKAQLELLKAQTAQIQLAWELPDEIRKKYKLRALTAEEKGIARERVLRFIRQQPGSNNKPQEVEA